MPLLVLTQLTQYWRYLELQAARGGEAAASVDGQTRTLTSLGTKVEGLGYCSGLTRRAAGGARRGQRTRRPDFERSAAAAVRLAMLLGRRCPAGHQELRGRCLRGGAVRRGTGDGYGVSGQLHAPDAERKRLGRRSSSSAMR